MVGTGLRWIDLATFVVAAATFLVAFLTFYVMTSRPRVRLSFWDPQAREPSQKIFVTTGNVTLHFLFRNKGDWLRIRRPAATLLTAFIYFPQSWEIKQARRFEAPTITSNEVFQASPSGRFANRKYIAVPSAYEPRPPTISIVSYNEDVICEVDAHIPDTEAGKRSKIECQMTSREGDLGVRSVLVQIEGKGQ